MNNLSIMVALALLACLLIVCMILLSVMAVQQKRRLAEMQSQMQALSNQFYEQLDYFRDESNQAFHNIADSITNTMLSIGNTQTLTLDSMQRQLSGATRDLQQQLNDKLSAMENSISRFDQRFEGFRQSSAQSIAELRKENNEQLTQMRKTVDEKLTETLNKRLNESFQQVSERLEQVYKGLGEMQTLASGVGDLKKVLTNVKTRGIWGELQLSRLLEQMLSRTQYEQNIAISPHAAERVQFAIKLPGQNNSTVYLPIDSKFPQEDYYKLISAAQDGDTAALSAAKKALTQQIKTEAKRISTKYIKPPYTTDFAIMFLPVEGLYAEVVKEEGLTETLQRDYRIVVAGPNTFAALLNALQMGFRTLAIQQRTGEVWKLLETVKADFHVFAETLDKTQLRLRQASETIDTAFHKTKSIQQHLNQVGQLTTEGSEQNIL